MRTVVQCIVAVSMLVLLGISGFVAADVLTPTTPPPGFQQQADPGVTPRVCASPGGVDLASCDRLRTSTVTSSMTSSVNTSTPIVTPTSTLPDGNGR